MSKKILMSLAPLLAVAAFAVMPAVSQAAPHWWKCEAKAGGKYHDPDCAEKTGGAFELTRLPFTSPVTKVRVKTFGVLTLHNEHIGEIKCFVDDHGKIWNVGLLTPGLDEVQVFENYECESVTAPCAAPGWIITAQALPWPTELLAGPPIRVKIGTAATPVKIKVECAALAVNEVFKGELTPRWVNNSPSYAEFDTPGSGSLAPTIPASGLATVTGKDFIIGVENAENILVFNP